MAGKCCKSESVNTPTGGCPVTTGDSGCCKKKCPTSCSGMSEWLGVPKCVVQSAIAIALIGITAAVTVNYLKRK